MSKRMDWRKTHYQTRIRDYGVTNIADETERRDDDRAARWLNRRLNPRPTPPTTPPTAPYDPYKDPAVIEMLGLSRLMLLD
jgi:hypothetical protein